MVEVKLCLRGGPYDGQTVAWEVPDAEDPPMSYDLKLHGPHEAAETYRYRRAARAPVDAAEDWIYEASDVGPR